MGGLLSRRKKPPGRQKNDPLKHGSSTRDADLTCPYSQSNRPSYSAQSPDIQPKLHRNQSLLDTPNFNVRIEPIEKAGNRMSKTHYFLIEEPKYRRCNSSKERCNPIELYANSSRLFNQSVEEPLLPFDMNEHITHNKHNSLPIRRGRSDTTDYLYNQKRALIARMLMKIPQATDVESHGVLMGTNWNFEEAERRLKMELVHRQIGANYKQSEALLMQHDWNLECALAWVQQNDDNNSNNSNNMRI